MLEFLIGLNQSILLIFGIFINQTVHICCRLSKFLICLNQKILLVFGTFTNQTVLMYYIRISSMFESKHFTRFRYIYKSNCSDI